MTGLQFVGDRFGHTPDAARALRHEAQRHLESALQGRRDTTAHDRGSQAYLKAPGEFGKFFHVFKVYPLLAYFEEKA